MPKLLKENRMVLIVLLGGLLFVIAASGLTTWLLLQPPPAPIIAANPTQANPSPIFSPTPQPASSPNSSPTPTPSPSAKPTPISATGDKLLLPTATPTPFPTPTHTSTPTPPPPTPVPQPQEGLTIGSIAPDFTLGSNRASRVSLSELRGKIVILNFWASWCPPCRHEVPALQSIHHQYGPQGVVVLAINEREKLENVERFAHDNGISFAVWLDEDGWAGQVYQVRAIPTTYFIDGEGIIRAVQIGTLTKDQIIAHLEKLL